MPVRAKCVNWAILAFILASTSLVRSIILTPVSWLGGFAELAM